MKKCTVCRVLAAQRQQRSAGSVTRHEVEAFSESLSLHLSKFERVRQCR